MAPTKRPATRSASRDFKVIIAADGQPRTHHREGRGIRARVPAGGVSVALDRVSQKTHATFISRARTEEDHAVLNEDGQVTIRGRDGAYTLERLTLSEEELADYYAGYSNQSLWPLFHSAVSRMLVEKRWYDGYVDVNRRFAEAINGQLDSRALVWVNDYQLSLVPSLLNPGPETAVALFWHIPWPVPDILRRLPERHAILESLLCCDVVGFHTEEYARNFLAAAAIELGAEIDEERLTAHHDGKTTRALVLPLGIDTGAIREVAEEVTAGPEVAGVNQGELAGLLERNTVLLGVDRLDYSKGIPQRLLAVDHFFERYPEYRGKAIYVGVMSPTRESITAYQQIKQEVADLERQINEKHASGDWKPLHLYYDGMPRAEITHLYTVAAACLVTSLADGMNLVAKEFVLAASCARNPGMLVLSEFAGAANDLGAALLVNPHDVDAVAEAIARALQMPAGERRVRMTRMARRLERDDVSTWAQRFIDEAMATESGQTDQVA